MKRNDLILMSYGFFWGVGALMLLTLAVKNLMLMLEGAPTLYWSRAVELTGSPILVVLIVESIAIGLGYLKGAFVLKKVVNRVSGQLQAGGSALNLRSALIIVLMISLGRLLNFLQTPCDLRFFIDSTIGLALLYGAGTFFTRLTSKGWTQKLGESS